MTKPKRLQFYTTDLQYRWRLLGGNREPLCNPGEHFTRWYDAYRNAAAALGVAQRSDLVVPDQRDRLALARLLHVQHPEVSEQAWADQLDPDVEPAS